MDIPDDYPFRTIPLQIEDANRTVADEYLKVLISTEELEREGLGGEDSVGAD